MTCYLYVACLLRFVAKFAANGEICKVQDVTEVA